MTDHKHPGSVAGLWSLGAAAVIALAACGGGSNPPEPPATAVTQMINAASGGTIDGPAL